MTICLGKSYSFGLLRVPFVNCCQFMYLVISLLVLRTGCGIRLHQFLIIAYLFTLQRGDKGDPANYCPISIVCILCKTMEPIIASILQNKLTGIILCMILSPKSHITASCTQTDLILLDFSKTVYKAMHLRLLYRLKMHGI